MHTDVNAGLIENVIMECFCNQATCMRSSVYAFSALWDASRKFDRVILPGCLLTTIPCSVESRRLPLDKPMFYLLDNMDSPKPEVQRAVQAWLKQEPQGFIKYV
jgi:hypothetical protein